MSENELYDELVTGVTFDEPLEERFGAEAAVGLPLPARLMLAIVLKQLRRVTCEHKDAILAQANKWIDDYVPNATLAAMCRGALHGAVAAFCGGA